MSIKILKVVKLAKPTYVIHGGEISVETNGIDGNKVLAVFKTPNDERWDFDEIAYAEIDGMFCVSFVNLKKTKV